VNHLEYIQTYRFIKKKDAKEVRQEGTVFTIGEKQVITQRTDAAGVIKDNVTKIYDKENNVIVYAYKTDDFFIDNADSIMEEDGKLTATGQTETINGYKCKAYALTSDSIGKLYNDYTVWITEDISIEDGISKLFPMPLINYNSIFSFKGVIVRIDYVEGNAVSKVQRYVTLVKAEHKSRIATVAMPWTRSTAKSIMPYRLSTGEFYQYTNEKYEDYMRRLYALRYKVTGKKDFPSSSIKTVVFRYSLF
jgi:hypothetical protein